MTGEIIAHYKIICKIGSGGMGEVYKAEDTVLKRIVALKFLPPSVSNDESARKRFTREAISASALDHPNICTIYETGQTEDGRLYISMAYYEGETLKEKIERSPLGIEESVNIILQVCEGLEKAHKNGIIHRDIKPSNIFITSDGLVKILDFGLAKVIGEARLTKIDNTLGTINYMSPEQAVGKKIDRGTDIWSLGVVFYEMLAGRLPFNADYEQAVIYSIMNEKPEPITSFHRGIPEELERIVDKTLIKNPDKRYRNISDIIYDLKGVQKDLQYAGPEYFKITTSKLPDPEKAGLNNRLFNRTEIFVKKYWKTVFPPVIVIMLTVLFFVFRPLKLIVLQSSSFRTSEKTLAVMYFENIHDPEDKDHMGDMLTNLLTTSLSQIRGIEVISRERLLEVQNDMGQTNTKNLTPSFAVRVANRAGVETMLIGSILRKSPTLAVTTRLIDVKSGRIISSNQLTDFSDNQIFKLVDSLTYLIRKNFRTTPASQLVIKSVSKVTTNSQEAYLAYVEGVDLYNRLYIGEASAAFAHAAQLDSSFAMAYFYLSVMQELMGEFNNSLESVQKAVKFIDKTTEREKFQILARNYELQNKPVKEAEVLEQLIGKYPHDIQAYLSLGLYLYTYKMLDLQKGIEVIRQGININPSAKHLWNQLAYSNAYLGKKHDAIDAVNKYINLAPAEPNPYDTKGDIYGYFGEYDSSRASFQKSFGLRRHFSADRLGEEAVLKGRYKEAAKYFEFIEYDLPVIDIHRGKLYAAQKKLEKLLNNRASGEINSKIYYRIMHLYYETAQYPEMLNTAKLLSTKVLSNPSENIYARAYLAWAFVKNGKKTDSYKVLNALRREITGSVLSLQIIVDYTSAIITFEEGDYNPALQKFRKVFELLPPNCWPSIFYAVTLIKNGLISAAIKELQSILYRQPSGEELLEQIPGNICYWPIPAVKARYWLGVAYEKEGNKIKALKEFEAFLNIWKDADFKSPEITDAKARIRMLKRIEIKD